MSTHLCLKSSLSDGRTVKRAGRRVAGSYGRAVKDRRVDANRGVRRYAKAALRRETA